MAWQGGCGGLMIAVFDDAAAGNARAKRQAQEVCRVCPVRTQCRRETLERAPWPADGGPTGVVAGVVIRAHHPRRRRQLVAASEGGSR